MPKNLLNFLFAESFQPDTDEAISDVMERMAEVEGLEVKKQPLEKALKDLELGVELKVELDANGAFVRVEDGCKYQEVASKLKQPDSIVQLAELGWVAAFANDVNSNNDPACFIINFVDISEIEPSDSDKVPDLEKLVNQMNDGNGEPPEGIGSDLKAPKTDDKGAKVPAAPKVKSAIKDSVSEDLFEQSFDHVMDEFENLDEAVKELVRKAAVDTLTESGFESIEESDIEQSIVRLFREYGNWDEIAKSAPQK
jgi:hypothetical protein